MRALKIVAIVLGGFVALIAILLLAVRLFVDPNNYKDRIAAAVKNSTGRELVLSGPIKLSVFPWIGLQIGPASLGNPAGFGAEPFAAVRHVVFRVRLLPLLRKEVQIGRIEIDGLDLRLRKNAAGRANWQDFGGKSAAPQPSPGPSSQAMPDLGGVEIMDSRVSYQDLVADHVNVELGHLSSGTPAPLRFKLDLKTSAGAQPVQLSGRLNLTSAGNSLAAKDVDIQLDDSRLRGDVAISNLQTSATGFDLAIDHIDLDRYRSPAGKNAKSPAPPPEKAAEPSTDALKSLRMNGTLTIGSAKVAGVNLTQVLVTVAAKDGVTRIAPVKAKLYGGDYSGDVTVDDRGPIPDLKLDQSMTGIDVAHLLEDFAKSQRVSGRGSVTTHLTAHSLGGDALMRSLNGHIAANVDNGAIEGVDLWFEINRAVALIQKQPVPGGQSSGRTKFDAFKASADLTNGIASTKDLYIASRNLKVTGEGTTNLITDAIAYRLKATILKEAPGGPAATAQTLADVPLDITGTVTSPAVRPDLQALAKARVQQELDKHKGELQQKLMDKLKDVFK
jgi:AsmA protein